MAKKKNSRVEEAMELVEEIMKNPREREIYESIEKARRDYKSGMRYAREQGIEQGAKQEKIEIAKAMLGKETDINFISEVTGLSKEEIEDIQKGVL